MDAKMKGFQDQPFFMALWNNLLAGWKVIFSECNWGCIKLLRRWEIKQLHKRLNEEYQNLGMLYAQAVQEKKSLDHEDTMVELPVNQILFLKDEIHHMEEELNTSRAEFLKQRNPD